MSGDDSSASANQQQQQQNLAHVAQGQIMQAAMNNASGGAAAASSGAMMTSSQAPPIMDLASILSKIQSLEKEKADMRAQLDMASTKLSKLQESKRAEMEQMMNSTINKWLENLSTSDPAAKDQLKDGLNRLVQSGDESGVWNVIACASSNWASNVNQIEQLTQQVNEYREKERLLSGGIFQSEGSRTSQQDSVPSIGDKRKFDGMSDARGSSPPGTGNDIWSEFQSMMMASGGNRGMDYGLEGSGRGGSQGLRMDEMGSGGGRQ